MNYCFNLFPFHLWTWMFPSYTRIVYIYTIHLLNLKSPFIFVTWKSKGQYSSIKCPSLLGTYLHHSFAHNLSFLSLVYFLFLINHHQQNCSLKNHIFWALQSNFWYFEDVAVWNFEFWFCQMKFRYAWTSY